MRGLGRIERDLDRGGLEQLGKLFAGGREVQSRRDDWTEVFELAAKLILVNLRADEDRLRFGLLTDRLNRGLELAVVTDDAVD